MVVKAVSWRRCLFGPSLIRPCATAETKVSCFQPQTSKFSSSLNVSPIKYPLTDKLDPDLIRFCHREPTYDNNLDVWSPSFLRMDEIRNQVPCFPGTPPTGPLRRPSDHPVQSIFSFFKKTSYCYRIFLVSTFVWDITALKMAGMRSCQ